MADQLAKFARHAQDREAEEKWSALAGMCIASELRQRDDVSWVPLPNEEVKGPYHRAWTKTFRAFELAATGVNVIIIDDTPDTVVSVLRSGQISAEVAEHSASKLVTKRRIHPGPRGGGASRSPKRSRRRDSRGYGGDAASEVGAHRGSFA